ncbi:UBP-type zinc finger domain-containing protein [Streptomyces sp. NPDC056210]|uniref:UBP-type zinc finger domain-containing protein n=1 Tax=unclassified Streptomyces TaxID=2593676 RepID=UPI0035D84E09
MARNGSNSSDLRQPVFSWVVSPDGGRPEGRTCSHLTALPRAPVTQYEVCAECCARGWPWTRLRWCSTCGHIGCCDTSRGQHAYAHYAQTGHPVVLALAPDESWAWCYVDQVFLVRVSQTDESGAPR